MKPVSPKRSALVAALDVGTSKIVCLIARLSRARRRMSLRRRSHAVEVIGFGHTRAARHQGRHRGRSCRGRGGDAPRGRPRPSASAGVQLESVIVSVSAGRLGERTLHGVRAMSPDSTVGDGDIAPRAGGRQPPFAARRPRGAAFAADRLRARRRARHPRSARHAGPALRRRHACRAPPMSRRRAT